MPITPLPSLERTDPLFKSKLDDFFLNQLPLFSVQVAAAANALNLASTTDVSASSIAVGDGEKTLLVSPGKSYQVGMYVVIADASDPGTNSMHGQITAYDIATGVLDVLVITNRGGGTHADWVITLSAPGAEAGFGDRQSWQAVGATKNTLFSNTSARPLALYVGGNVNTGGGYWEMRINGLVLYTPQLTAGWNHYGLYIIPPGASYGAFDSVGAGVLTLIGFWGMI